MNQERRRAPRYRIDTAIAVDGGTGRTIDLSANSVYFESPRKMSPGDEVALVFPFEHGAPHALVNCTARVIRVDARGALFGIAAVYEPVSFRVSAST
ncbi:MAG: PilZ domain-containing protein [Vicinamibacterales bacterium]